MHCSTRKNNSRWYISCGFNGTAVCYQLAPLCRYHMSDLLDPCLGHNMRYLNSSCHASFIKVVDLLASEFEFHKFLVVILEMCDILLVETMTI